MEKASNPRTRLELLQSCIIPIMIYDCQTWALLKHQTSLVQVCQRKVEGKIIDIRITDKIINKELRRSGLEDAATAAHLSSGSGEDTWPEWIKKDGFSPQQFGTQELVEETEASKDTSGHKR